MRVLVMRNMGGMPCIMDWRQVNGGAPRCEEGRRLYAVEINATVCGSSTSGSRSCWT